MGYFFIGSFFIISGPPFDTGTGRMLGLTGLLGLCGPLVLLGLHMAFSGPAGPLGLRRSLFGALVATLSIGIVGATAALFQPDLQSHAADFLLGVIVSTVLFGWPLLAALFSGHTR